MRTQIYLPTLGSFYEAPIRHLQKLKFHQRIEILLESSLTTLKTKLLALMPEQLRFHFILPEISSARYALLNPQEIKRHISRALPTFSVGAITFSHADECPANLLIQFQKELQQQKWHGIIYGSVDSWFDTAILEGLAEQNILQRQNMDYGLIPGEGAALVLLQTHPTFPVLATLKVATVEAIHPVVSSCAAVVTSFGKQASDPIEWYQKQQLIWPNLPEEWNTYSTLGDLGNTEFPLHLILASERLRYPFPAMESTLIMQIKTQSNWIVICSLGSTLTP
jgi:hypothetical protein